MTISNFESGLSLLVAVNALMLKNTKLEGIWAKA